MEEKEIWFPTAEQLEEALKKERYKKNYGRALRSTVYSLLVVMAVAVILSVLLMPVMQISGESMSPTLEDKEIVIAVNDHRYNTGDVIGFYFNILIELCRNTYEMLSDMSLFRRSEYRDYVNASYGTPVHLDMVFIDYIPLFCPVFCVDETIDHKSKC